MLVLAVNCGSSSLKFKVVKVGSDRSGGPAPARTVLCTGAVEEIGERATLTLHRTDGRRVETRRAIGGHADAVHWMLQQLQPTGTQADRVPLDAVGHRVVHGGESFRESVRITDEVLDRLDALGELAPLHNPACVDGIRGAQKALGPSVPMVAVFDTAFHRTMPDCASRYALPRDLVDRHHIVRYGFHGIAHAAVAAGLAEQIGTPLDRLRLITVHLGNGSSMTAIKGGRSIDTSMGFTPLEGLVMGTRSGDLDPAVVGYLTRKEGISVDAVEHLLNHESGLLGVSGLSRDMREVLAAAEGGRHPNADRAVSLFCYRAKKYLGAYLAALGGADAVVFSGGIGEHAPAVRARICDGMEWCGLRIDHRRNAAVTRVSDGEAVAITEPGASLQVYVMCVDEETWIAQETVRCLGV